MPMYPNRAKRPWREALRMYLHDANSSQLTRFGRALAAWVAGYGTFAAVNDAAAPFTLGAVLIDDWTIPPAILAVAVVVIWRGIMRYRKLPRTDTP